MTVSRRLPWPPPVRARVALPLAVSTLLLVAGLGAGAADRLRARADAAGTVGHVGGVLTAQELIHPLQRERGLALGVLAGDDRFVADLDAERRVTDRARARLDTATPGLRAALTGLREARSGTATAQEAFSAYTGAISALLDASFAARPGGLQSLEALEAISRAKEAACQERALVTAAFATGSFTSAGHLDLLQVRAIKADAFARFERVATATGRAALARAQQSGHPPRLAAMERQAVAGTPLSASPRAWHHAAIGYDEALRSVQRSVAEEVRAPALAAAERATLHLALLGALGAVLVLGMPVLGVLASRSALRPLRRLSDQADALAEHVSRLAQGGQSQDVLAQRSRDPRAGRRDGEFAGVAGALGDLHRSAVRLAAEHTALRRVATESLVDLGVRHRNLAHRQLSFIGMLQREESDPAALARLCELDRLTSRLRRNAESLLVLTGKRGARRSSEPVPVADVLRLALTEVEDHHRVTLRVVDGAPVRGAVVAEVAHLLAELVENALTYSPPDAEVEVWARADEGECRITITDHGIGMTAEELAAANARLRGEESFLVAPTRCLGHHVVGRLADRLGVRVWLHESLPRGVTARVALPEELLAVPSRPEQPPELLGGVSAR
ncbi:sensor histidine kinase [Nonomuraea glycinis]|uniref:sensor histidine kinase n=1 Tax=Nonomuraea glycinis TaxID=2047744 RepID=UPI002E1447FB|nr:nitrate- and nitrite sensing domain-containing protein [Nonomuraea glycinis]